MDPALISSHCCWNRFPRRRGDGPPPELIRVLAHGFPPQARGWTPTRADTCPGPRVSPAGAGMDPCRDCPADISDRFPRRRGDGPVWHNECARAMLFPPQARGWTFSHLKNTHAVQVSPAGAGMDPMPFSASQISVCFPRRRGDGPC